MQTDATTLTRHVKWNNFAKNGSGECSPMSWHSLFDYTMHAKVSRYLESNPEVEIAVEGLQHKCKLNLVEAYSYHYFEKECSPTVCSDNNSTASSVASVALERLGSPDSNSPAPIKEPKVISEKPQESFGVASSDSYKAVAHEPLIGETPSNGHCQLSDAHDELSKVEDEPSLTRLDPVAHVESISTCPQTVSLVDSEASRSSTNLTGEMNFSELWVASSSDNHRSRRCAARSPTSGPKLHAVAQLMLMEPPSAPSEPWYFYSEEQAKHFLNDYLHTWVCDIAENPSQAKKQAKLLLQQLWQAFSSSQQIAAEYSGYAPWSPEPMAFIIDKLASLIRKKPQKQSHESSKAVQGAIISIQGVIHSLEDDFKSPRYSLLVETMTQQLGDCLVSGNHLRDSVDVTAICYLMVPSDHSAFDARTTRNVQTLMRSGVWCDGWVVPLRATLFRLVEQEPKACSDLLKWAPHQVVLEMLQEYADYVFASSDATQRYAGLINTVAALLAHNDDAQLAELCCTLLVKCELSEVLPLLHGAYSNNSFARTLLRALEKRLLAGTVDDVFAHTIDNLHPTLLQALQNPNAWLHPAPVNAINSLEMLARLIKPLVQRRQYDNELIRQLLPEVALRALKAGLCSDSVWEILHELLGAIPERAQITGYIAQAWSRHRIPQKHISGTVRFFHKYDSSLQQAFQALSAQPHYLLQLYGSLYGEDNPEIAQLSVNNQKVLPVLETALWHALQIGLEVVPEGVGSCSLAQMPTESDVWQAAEILETVADTLSEMDTIARSALVTALGANPDLIALRRKIALVAKNVTHQSQSTLELLIAVSAEERYLNSYTNSLRPLIGQAIWIAIEQGEAPVIQRISCNKRYKHTIVLCTCEELSKHHLTAEQLSLGEYLLRSLDAEPEHFLLIKRSSPDLLIAELINLIMSGASTDTIIHALEQYCRRIKNSPEAIPALVLAWKKIIAFAGHPETNAKFLQALLTLLIGSEQLEALFGAVWPHLCACDPVGAAVVAHAMLLYDPNSQTAYKLVQVSLQKIFLDADHIWRQFIDIGIESETHIASSFQILPKPDVYSFINWLLHFIAPNDLETEHKQLLLRRLVQLTSPAEALRLLSPFTSVLKEALKNSVLAGLREEIASISMSMLAKHEWFRNFAPDLQHYFVAMIAEELAPPRLASAKINLKEISGTSLWSWAVMNCLFKLAPDFDISPEALRNPMVVWDMQIRLDGEPCLTNNACIRILQESTDILEGLVNVPHKNRLWHRLAKRMLVAGVKLEQLFGSICDATEKRWPEIVTQADNTLQSVPNNVHGLLHIFQRYAYACCMGEPAERLAELEASVCELGSQEHLNPDQFDESIGKLLIKSLYGIHAQSLISKIDPKNMHSMQGHCRAILKKLCAIHHYGCHKPAVLHQLQKWQTLVIQTISAYTEKLLHDKGVTEVWTVANSWLTGTYFNITHHPATQNATIELLEAVEALMEKTIYLSSIDDVVNSLETALSADEEYIEELLPYINFPNCAQHILEKSAICAASLYGNLVPIALRSVAGGLKRMPHNVLMQSLACSMAYSAMEIMIGSPAHCTTRARLLPQHELIQHCTEEEWRDKLTSIGPHSIWPRNTFSLPEGFFTESSTPNAWLCPNPQPFVTLGAAISILRMHHHFEIWQGCAYLVIMLNEGILRTATLSPDPTNLNTISAHIVGTVTDAVNALEQIAHQTPQQFSTEKSDTCSLLLHRCTNSTIDTLTILTPLMIDDHNIESLEYAANKVMVIANKLDCRNRPKIAALKDLILQESTKNPSTTADPLLNKAVIQHFSDSSSGPILQREFLECLLKGFAYFADTMMNEACEPMLCGAIRAWLDCGLTIEHYTTEHPLIQPLGAQIPTRLVLSAEIMRCILKDHTNFKHDCTKIPPAEKIIFFQILDWAITDLVTAASTGQLEQTALLLRKDRFTYLLAHTVERIHPQFPYGTWCGSHKTSEKQVQRLIGEMDFLRTSINW